MSHVHDFLQQYPSSTAGLYARTLAGFIASTGVSIEEATQDHVLTYYKSLEALAPSTVSLKLAILSSWYAYLQRRGLRTDNPMVAIAHRPKVDKQGSVKWLDAMEQRVLLDAEGDEKQAVRNKAILWVLLHGLRLAELVSLDVEDYRYGELRFTGKGGKSRIVPMLAPAQIALQAYLGPRRSGPLFRVARHRISRRQVQRVVNAATMRTVRRMSPHALRHSFATRNVKAGMGIPQLQKIMGHQALSSTQLYVHLDTEDIRQAMLNDPLAEAQEFTVIEGGKVTATG